MLVVVDQFDNLVFVPREGEVRRPAEVPPRVVIPRREFNTRIADMTCLQVDGRVARRYGDLRVEGLVVGVGPVPRCREADVAPQTGVETQLVGAGPLRVEVADRIVRLGGPDLVCGIVLVGRDGQVPREGHTHRGNRTADLQIGQRTAHVPERGGHPRQSDRRVEKRRFGRFGQLRGPVVTARHREVEHLLPPHLHRGE